MPPRGRPSVPAATVHIIRFSRITQLMILAAIDVGSNALRMLIGRVAPDGRIVPLAKSIREPIRLGNDVFRLGAIEPETVERVVSAFRRFRAEAARLGAEKIRAVGTSALREARNTSDVVHRVEAETGIHIETISGDEEARLVFTAVSNRVSLTGRVAMLIDVGGGSVEVSLVDDGAVVASESAKLGAVRLLEICAGATVEELTREISGRSEALRRRIMADLGGRRLDFCVGTGGNLETLGSLRKKLVGIGDPGEVTFSDLESILGSLQSMDLEERVNSLGIRPDRADVIVPACVLLRELMNEVSAERILLPRVGLKEGALLDMWQSLSNQPGEEG